MERVEFKISEFSSSEDFFDRMVFFLSEHSWDRFSAFFFSLLYRNFGYHRNRPEGWQDWQLRPQFGYTAGVNFNNTYNDCTKKLDHFISETYCVLTAKCPRFWNCRFKSIWKNCHLLAKKYCGWTRFLSLSHVNEGIHVKNENPIFDK